MHTFLISHLFSLLSCIYVSVHKPIIYLNYLYHTHKHTYCIYSIMANVNNLNQGGFKNKLNAETISSHSIKLTPTAALPPRSKTLSKIKHSVAYFSTYFRSGCARPNDYLQFIVPKLSKNQSPAYFEKGFLKHQWIVVLRAWLETQERRKQRLNLFGMCHQDTKMLYFTSHFKTIRECSRLHSYCNSWVYEVPKYLSLILQLILRMTLVRKNQFALPTG